MVARARLLTFTASTARCLASDVGVCTLTPCGGGVALGCSTLGRLASECAAGLGADFAAVAFGGTGAGAGTALPSGDVSAAVNAGDAGRLSIVLAFLAFLLGMIFLALGFESFGSESEGSTVVRLRIRCRGVRNDSACKALSSSDAVAAWVSSPLKAPASGALWLVN